MSDVPLHWRDQCWEYLLAKRTTLTVDGVGSSALLENWRHWQQSQS